MMTKTLSRINHFQAKWSMIILPFVFMAAFPMSGCATQDTNYYEITTSRGKMVVRLYDETPIHRDNFKKLVAEKLYDGTTFHRIIPTFMIQGGDPNSLDDDPMNDGLGGNDYTLPAEIIDSLTQKPFDGILHKRGALAAARQGDQMNPDRESSGSQFYIVQGQVYSADILGQMETTLQRNTGTEFTFSEEAFNLYSTVGGVPWLDGQYTVFGELVEGFETLDSLAAVDTPNRLGQQVHPALGDQPIEKIPMTIRALPGFREQ